MAEQYVDVRAFRRMAARFPRELSAALKVAILVYLRDFDARFISDRLSGSRRGGVGLSGGLARRTGNLARSFRALVLGESFDLTGVYFTTSIYARALEFGATIRPQRGNWLWVPLKPLLTPSGVFRGWERLPPESSRFFRRSKRNPQNLVLLGRSGARGRGQVRAYAVLAKEVYVPPRMGLVKMFRDDHIIRVRTLNEAVAYAARRAR